MKVARQSHPSEAASRSRNGRRRVAQIESMIADFSRMAADLDREIATEEQRSGITDPTHFAYPTYARAAVVRRDNLKRSADELKGQLAEARGHFEVAVEELRKTGKHGRSRQGRALCGAPAHRHGPLRDLPGSRRAPERRVSHPVPREVLVKRARGFGDGLQPVLEGLERHLRPERAETR